MSTDIPECFSLLLTLDKSLSSIKAAPFFKAAVLVSVWTSDWQILPACVHYMSTCCQVLCRALRRPKPLPLSFLHVIDKLNAIDPFDAENVPFALREERPPGYYNQGWTGPKYPQCAPQLAGMVEAFAVDGGVELFIARCFQQVCSCVCLCALRCTLASTQL
jgi:hypothetical protein